MVLDMINFSFTPSSKRPPEHIEENAGLDAVGTLSASTDNRMRFPCHYTD
jgi:hypothetical protein